MTSLPNKEVRTKLSALGLVPLLPRVFDRIEPNGRILEPSIDLLGVLPSDELANEPSFGRSVGYGEVDRSLEVRCATDFFPPPAKVTIRIRHLAEELLLFVH